MAQFPLRVKHLTWAAGLAVAFAAVPALTAVPGHVAAIAWCAPSEVPNPRGYGCVPALAPGGAVVGAPTEQELSVCHGGNLYFCIDPYGRL
jgi:hypothetical protein